MKVADDAAALVFRYLVGARVIMDEAEGAGTEGTEDERNDPLGATGSMLLGELGPQVLGSLVTEHLLILHHSHRSSSRDGRGSEIGSGRWSCDLSLAPFNLHGVRGSARASGRASSGRASQRLVPRPRRSARSAGGRRLRRGRIGPGVAARTGGSPWPLPERGGPASPRCRAAAGWGSPGATARASAAASAPAAPARRRRR